MDASGNTDTPLIDGLVEMATRALPAAEQLYAETRQSVGQLVIKDGRVSGALVEQNQTAVHGLSWVATYVEGLRQMLSWAERLSEEDRLGEL